MAPRERPGAADAGSRPHQQVERWIMKTLALAALVLVAGCSAPKFENPAVSDDVLRRDAYECERDARGIRGDSCDHIGLYTRCMESKGHRRVPGTGSPC